jgi:hypothetical protein
METTREHPDESARACVRRPQKIFDNHEETKDTKKEEEKSASLLFFFFLSSW